MNPASPHRVSGRHGSVLVVVLVLIVMLSLAAYAFSELMIGENAASEFALQHAQARACAESGIEYAAVVLGQAEDPEQPLNFYHDPSQFSGILVAEQAAGRFTFVAPLETDAAGAQVRYGLIDESARINLNAVLSFGLDEEQSAAMLINVPGMTEEIADAILDWIDADSDMRLLGAERDYYSSLNPPYAPRNGPIGSIEELLLVRDVTPALLFGADLNRNAAIEEEGERPLTEIENVDNSLGTLDRGWAAYLTLDSAEANLRPDGQPKIDVNMDDLQALHTQLAEVLDQDMANFIIAYRQGGPYQDQGNTGQAASSLTLDFTQPGRQKLTTILDLIGVSTQVARTPGAAQPAQGSNPGPTQGGSQKTNQNSRIVVTAAFPNQPGAMQSYLPKLMDNLAVNAAATIPGRININQAPKSLLAGIPGLNPNAVDQIIANRDVTLGQQRPEQVHETWLLSSGVVELAEMKKLMALVTTGGNVYRAQVVGFFDAEGPADRLEVVIDATQSPPIVRRRWELRELGPGYSAEVLGVPVADMP